MAINKHYKAGIASLIEVQSERVVMPPHAVGDLNQQVSLSNFFDRFMLAIDSA